MEDVSTQNRDLLQVVAKCEETIHNTQLRLEERSRECDSLYRQLEEAQRQVTVHSYFFLMLQMLHLCEVRVYMSLCSQVDQSLERLLSKEHSAQSKMLDLESQLSLAKNELGQLRRSKEDVSVRWQTMSSETFHYTSIENNQTIIL